MVASRASLSFGAFRAMMMMMMFITITKPHGSFCFFLDFPNFSGSLTHLFSCTLD